VVNLYPSQVEDIVRRYPEVSEFVIEHRHERRMDEVVLVLESSVESFNPERLEADLRQALGVRLETRVMPAGSLEKSDLKARRIVRK
jgi:phenylacetate-CoA ligase